LPCKAIRRDGEGDDEGDGDGAGDDTLIRLSVDAMVCKLGIDGNGNDGDDESGVHDVLGAEDSDESNDLPRCATASKSRIPFGGVFE
jgi:hypothetical protein